MGASDRHGAERADDLYVRAHAARTRQCVAAPCPGRPLGGSRGRAARAASPGAYDAILCTGGDHTICHHAGPYVAARASAAGLRDDRWCDRRQCIGLRHMLQDLLREPLGLVSLQEAFPDTATQRTDEFWL